MSVCTREGAVVDEIRAAVDRLDDYSVRTRPLPSEALAAVDDYAQALQAYQLAPNEVAGACAAQVTMDGEDTLVALQRHDELPAAFAAALRALDQRPGPDGVHGVADRIRFDHAVDGWLDDPTRTAGQLRDHATDRAGEEPLWRDVHRLYNHPTGAWGSVVGIGRSVRWGHARSMLRGAERLTEVSHRDLQVGNRAARRAEARRLRALGRRRLPRAARAMRAADDVLDAPGPIRSGLTRAVPTLGRALDSPVARVGGRALGGVGTVVGGFDAYNRWNEGDRVGAGFTAGGAVGGALLLAGGPVTLAVGGTLVLGSLAYEYRDGIGDFVDSAGDVAGSVVSGVGDGLSAAGDAISSAGGAVADGIGSISRGIGGLFD